MERLKSEILYFEERWVEDFVVEGCTGDRPKILGSL